MAAGAGFGYIGQSSLAVPYGTGGEPAVAYCVEGLGINATSNPLARQSTELLTPRVSQRPFLTAQWRYLSMLNFRIDPAVLRPHVPAGTELDLWRGDALVSVVGFRFVDTRGSAGRSRFIATSTR